MHHRKPSLSAYNRPTSPAEARSAAKTKKPPAAYTAGGFGKSKLLAHLHLNGRGRFRQSSGLQETRQWVVAQKCWQRRDRRQQTSCIGQAACTTTDAWQATAQQLGHWCQQTSCIGQTACTTTDAWQATAQQFRHWRQQTRHVRQTTCATTDAWQTTAQQLGEWCEQACGIRHTTGWQGRSAYGQATEQAAGTGHCGHSAISRQRSDRYLRAYSAAQQVVQRTSIPSQTTCADNRIKRTARQATDGVQKTLVKQTRIGAQQATNQRKAITQSWQSTDSGTARPDQEARHHHQASQAVHRSQAG